MKFYLGLLYFDNFFFHLAVNCSLCHTSFIKRCCWRHSSPPPYLGVLLVPQPSQEQFEYSAFGIEVSLLFLCHFFLIIDFRLFLNIGIELTFYWRGLKSLGPDLGPSLYTVSYFCISELLFLVCYPFSCFLSTVIVSLLPFVCSCIHLLLTLRPFCSCFRQSTSYHVFVHLSKQVY